MLGKTWEGVLILIDSELEMAIAKVGPVGRGRDMAVRLGLADWGGIQT